MRAIDGMIKWLQAELCDADDEFETPQDAIDAALVAARQYAEPTTPKRCETCAWFVPREKRRTIICELGQPPTVHEYETASECARYPERVPTSENGWCGEHKDG